MRFLGVHVHGLEQRLSRVDESTARGGEGRDSVTRLLTPVLADVVATAMVMAMIGLHSQAPTSMPAPDTTTVVPSLLSPLVGPLCPTCSGLESEPEGAGGLYGSLHIS